ncbi:MAG: hypothetical protein C5B59_12435 [Bacteroidetes bacterium]|nr:MAG: hypothetical protein C5B59_12435 [Bacteroidota bacterium]
MEKIIVHHPHFAGCKESLFSFTKKTYSRLLENSKILQIKCKAGSDSDPGFIFAEKRKLFLYSKLIIKDIFGT